MTSLERRRIRQTAFLGLGLTVLVVLAQLFGLLIPLEHMLHDQRAQRFQYFTPPPTDQLVHLDIDDGSLDAMGRWPWPRSRLARVLEELDRADVRAVGLDITLLEPQDPSYTTGSDGSPGELIDHDARLAESLEQLDCALVPLGLSIKPQQPPTEIHRTARQLLYQDLELPPERLRRRLGITERDLESAGVEFKNLFIRARQWAMYERVLRALEDDPELSGEALRRRLLPNQPETGSNALTRLLDRQHRRAVAMRHLRRFSRPAAEAPVTALPGHEATPPLAPFGRAARASGFTDYLPNDGGIRQIPLWVQYRDRLYPQLAFSLACLSLGVDVTDVQLDRNRITIPRPDAPTIEIPVHRQPIEAYGRSFGLFMEIPWFGPADDWEYMYDHPEHRRAKQHVPVSRVWDAIQNRERLRNNNKLADDALKFFYDIYAPNKLEAYEQDPPPLDDTAARIKAIDALLDDIGPFLQPLLQDRTEGKELKPLEQRQLTNYDRLRRIRKNNPRLQEEIRQTRDELRAKLEDKTILIGWTATGTIADFVPTPLHAQCPGVVAHGTILNGILTGHMWRTAPGWIAPVLTGLFGLLCTAFVAVLAPSAASIATVAAVGVWALINGVLLFDYGDWLVPPAGPLVVAALVWAGCTVWQFVLERADRARITRRFRSYVDPSLVNYVMEHPDQTQFEGQIRELSVVFTDLAGFTSLSERLGADTVPVLNRYMGLMVPLIRKYDGYVNKFLGDGIMFFYGAPRENPNHAADAVATVLAMQRAMEPFNRELAEQDLPTVRMRAGIATGPMVVGDAGPPDAADYTVLGDTVNLAARLESANKATGTYIMLSQRTADLLDESCLLRPLARLQVIGKSQNIMTYEPLGYTTAPATGSGDADGAEAPDMPVTDEQRQLVTLTEQMVEAYIAGRFDDCLSAADRLDEAFGPTKLTDLYRDSCQQMREMSAEEFAGQIVLSEK